MPLLVCVKVAKNIDNMDNQRKKYRIVSTTINHIARKRLELSNDEMVLCDLVFKLSHQRPCNLSREKQADVVGVTVRGVQKMIKRLIDKGLIEKNVKHELWTTQKYVDAILLADEEKEAYFRGEQSSPIRKNTDEQSSPLPRTKFTPPPEQSSPNTNNIDTNKDIVCEGENKNPEAHTQKNENSISEKEEPAPLKSESNTAKAIDYEAKAKAHIMAVLNSTPQTLKDVWAMRYNQKLRQAGTDPQKEIEKFAAWYLDKYFPYLEGATLFHEVQGRAARTFRNSFANSWLKNIKTSGANSSSSPYPYKHIA